MNVFVKYFMEKGLQMSDVREKLSRMMTAFGVSKYKELAQKLGVSPNTIDVWKKRNAIPEKNLYKCVNLTGYPLDWIENGGELKKNTQDLGSSESNMHHENSTSVPLLQAGAGAGIYNYQSEEVLLTLNTNIFTELRGKPVTAVEVVGDSMEPVLRRGDYILVTPPQDERRTEDGIYAIRIDGAIKIKALQFQLDGTIKILSYNQHYSPEIYDPAVSQVDFEILGKHCMTIAR